MKTDPSRAGSMKPPHAPKTPTDGGNPGDEEHPGDAYPDEIRQYRSRRTGRYVTGPDGPKRNRPD